jgi:hypothetical protein
MIQRIIRWGWYPTGKNITYVGTEKQLLEAAFQEYQFWFADGPSFSEEEALEFIRERAV